MASLLNNTKATLIPARPYRDTPADDAPRTKTA